MKACIPSRLAVPRLAGVATIALMASCTGAEEDRLGTWEVERDTIGDTVVVRTVSGSVWGAPATMREEVAIGVLEGQEELMFASIQAMAVDASPRKKVSREMAGVGAGMAVGLGWLL